MARKRQTRGGAVVQANVRTNPARRAVRPNIRGAIRESTIIRGNEALLSMDSQSNGSGGGLIAMVPGLSLGRVQSSLSAVAGMYCNGKFMPGTVLHYAPSTGSTTSGVIHIAWIDNPEIIASAYANTSGGTPTVALNSAAWRDFVRSIGNVRTYSVWEAFDFPMPTTLRRKMFNVNATMTETGELSQSPLVDRSAQGIWVWAVEGAPAVATAMGRPWIHAVLQLEGLRSVFGPISAT